MADVAFVAPTGGTVALAAAGTAKTILNVIAAANRMITVTEFSISFDGVAADQKPILVELCKSSQGGAGSGSSSVTPNLVRGNPSATVQATAAKNYATTEPTTLTAVREYLIDPNKGLAVIQFPLGREVESIIAGGVCLRCTIQTGGAALNARAHIEWEE